MVFFCIWVEFRHIAIIVGCSVPDLGRFWGSFGLRLHFLWIRNEILHLICFSPKQISNSFIYCSYFSWWANHIFSNISICSNLETSAQGGPDNRTLYRENGEETKWNRASVRFLGFLTWSDVRGFVWRNDVFSLMCTHGQFNACMLNAYKLQFWALF